ncbi:hypothetical protein [Azospirillum argentinense]
MSPVRGSSKSPSPLRGEGRGEGETPAPCRACPARSFSGLPAAPSS